MHNCIIIFVKIFLNFITWYFIYTELCLNFKCKLNSCKHLVAMVVARRKQSTFKYTTVQIIFEIICLLKTNMFDVIQAFRANYAEWSHDPSHDPPFSHSSVL